MMTALKESAKVARSVPLYPEIRSDGITPAGFGNDEGNVPCFSTEYNQCSLYIPHSNIDDLLTAIKVFQSFVPHLDEIWSCPCDISFKTEIDGAKMLIYGRFAFSHILIDVNKTISKPTD